MSSTIGHLGPIRYRQGGESRKCTKYVTTGNSSFYPVNFFHTLTILVRYRGFHPVSYPTMNNLLVLVHSRPTS